MPFRFSWSDEAQESFWRHARDQDGLRAVANAVHALAGEPFPPWPAASHHGTYHRLHVGDYRVLYKVGEDVITIERVDKVTRR